REQGKTLTRYVPPDQVEVLTQHTANFQKFQELVGQYAQIIIEQTRAERIAGLKKRPRTPDPPGPRPGNPTVDGALPGGPTQWSGGSGTGSPSAYGGVQIGQPDCGMAAAECRRPNRRCLSTQAKIGRASCRETRYT